MRPIRRILAAAAAAIVCATIAVPNTTAAPAAAYDPNAVTWYVCKGTAYHALTSAASPSAVNIARVAPGTQFRGVPAGTGYMKITEGALAGKFSPTANLCQTSTLGVHEQWKTRALARYNRAKALETPTGMRPDHYARMAHARALLTSWNDAEALAYLNKGLATEIGGNTGGFGLPAAWDAFQDGTVNPVTTAYTITGTEHFGRPLLDAYRAGRTEYGPVIQRIINKVQSIPTVAGDPDCVAYSEHPNDHGYGKCVYNVNASFGSFLIRAGWLGFDVDEARAHRAIGHTMNAYDHATAFWRYASTWKVWNGPDHNAFQTVTMNEIHPSWMRPGITNMMSRGLGAESGQAHTVLAEADCAGSRRWLSEHDHEFGVTFHSNVNRQAYGAQAAALAYASCSGRR